MPVLDVHLDGDGVWPDMANKRVIETQDMQIAALNGGMSSGRPSIALRIDLPDGSVVFAQTSYRLFMVAADMLRTRYGEPT